MLKKAVVILLLICVIVGCDGKRKYTGSYGRLGIPDDFLQLNKNGTFVKVESHMVDPQTNHKGTWEMNENEVILTLTHMWSEEAGNYTAYEGRRISYDISEYSNPAKGISQDTLVDIREGVEWKKN